MIPVFMDLGRTNVLAIPATAAAMLYRDVQKNIRLRSDQDFPDYKRLERHLRPRSDANRRRDTCVKYIYSMPPYPGPRPVSLFWMRRSKASTNRT